MTQETYTGPSGGLKKDSPWLASEDIGTGEQRVMIEDVSVHKNVKFEAGRTEAKVGAVKFVGMEKRMILNATNRKFLAKHYTMDTAQWRKVWVTLWVDTNIKGKAGEIVSGLRIKLAAQDDTPDAWASWGAEERGEWIARKGTARLKDWWTALPKPDRDALAGKLDGWKATAATIL